MLGIPGHFQDNIQTVNAVQFPILIVLLQMLSRILRDAGIQEMLERVSGEKGMVWDDFFGKLKKNNQWHVEVY